ncbi:hypothetical protein BDW22DRAFT_1427543 [Trametopsis cervina]|nr:hypothetical protein BDW22DRAFT_1427543 [Trametopsis cervina]
MSDERPSTYEFGRVYDVTGREETRYGLLADGSTFWITRDRSPGETTERSNQAADSDSEDSDMADDEDKTGEVLFGGSVLPAFEPAEEQEGSAAGKHTTVHPNESASDTKLHERPSSPSFSTGGASLTFGGPSDLEFRFTLSNRVAGPSRKARAVLSASPPLYESARSARSSAGESGDEEDEDGDWLMETPLPAFMADETTADGHRNTENTEPVIDTTMAELPTFASSSPSSDDNGSEATGVWEVDLPAFEDNVGMGEAADYDEYVERTAVGALQLELNAGEVNDPRGRHHISPSLTALPSVVREASLSGSEESVFLDDGSHVAVDIRRGTGEVGLAVSALAELPSFGDAPMEDTSDSESDASAREVESPAVSDPLRPAGSSHAFPPVDTNPHSDHKSDGRSGVAEDELSGLGLLPAFGDPPVAYEKSPSSAGSSRMSSRSRSSRVVSFAGVEEAGSESDSQA